MEVAMRRYAVVLVLALGSSGPAPPVSGAGSARVDEFARAQPVAGSGVHYFTTALVHSTEPTATGMIQRSTETVELDGGLAGRLLYHPTSVFDFEQGTLVNTGAQVFSGAVLGSAPVMLFDDAFRFEIDLNTGATRGEVRLTDSLAGPKVRCRLHVVGTGMTAEGNATFDYTGECRFRGE
jgi:hypothetical protein